MAIRPVPEQALSLARQFEGLRLRPYLCPAGIPTIGYGHTGPDVTLNSPPITRSFAETLLIEDMGRFANGAMRLCPVLATESDGRLAAIADFAFNLGLGRLQTSTLRRRVNQRDWPSAANELRRWVRGGGRALPGLVARREAEAALLLGD